MQLVIKIDLDHQSFKDPEGELDLDSITEILDTIPRNIETGDALFVPSADIVNFCGAKVGTITVES